MYKKGVITDEISQDFKQAVELAAEYDLDGVEIRSVWEKGPHELDKNDIKKMKSILAETKLDVCGISAPFFKCDLENETEINEQMDILQKCIELAQTFGTNIIRGFTFWNKGNFDGNLDKIVSKFDNVLPILEKENVILALEFDPSVFATNAKTLVQVIKKIDSSYVKGLWDPGNDIYDPDEEIPFPNGYEILKPYMIHMHLKDAVKNSKGKIEAVPIGDGQVDYEGHFKALEKDKYEGYVVLETHYRPKHEIDEKLMTLPKGSAFSHMGYEASKDSLEKWKRLEDKVSGK